MNKKFIILIVLFVLLVGASVYVGYSNKTKTSIIKEEETTIIKSPLGEFNAQEPQTTTLESIPPGAISIKISQDKDFQPNEFSVKAGEVVNLVLTGLDGTHTLYFDDKSLEKVEIDVGNGETRGISFVAPQQKGEYKFYCDIPGHRQNGEEGIMIVK